MRSDSKPRLEPNPLSTPADSLLTEGGLAPLERPPAAASGARAPRGLRGSATDFGGAATAVEQGRGPGRLGALLALLLLLAVAPGCDSPACVFASGGCQDQPGTPLGEGPALIPEDGEWIADGRPRLEAVFPTGDGVHPQSPIVLRFSESMNPATVSSGAFILVNASQVGAVPPIAAPFLLGDGRFLVLVPATDLPLGAEIQVRYQEGVDATDLTGQLLDAEPDSVIGGFTVATAVSDVPTVVATWPPADVDDASATTEIVTVFDQPMSTTNLSGGGWTLSSGGVPLPIDGLFPLPLVTGSRVWQLPEPATPYAAGANLSVSLSPSGTELESEAGQVLPSQTIDFSIAPFGPPIDAAITSAPDDAIGIANLIAASDRPFQLTLTLSSPQVGDQLSVFAFGTSLDDEVVQDSFQGDFEIATLPDANPDGTFSVPLELATIPIADPETGDALFADGDVNMALRVTRGSVISPIRLLDIDPQVAGVQPPLLDTVRPSFVELTGNQAVPTDFRSSLVDLVLTGRADEQLRAVFVEIDDPAFGPDPVSNSDLMDSEFPPVVGSSFAGDFIAAPVPIGVVRPQDVGGGTTSLATPAISYRFRLYDQALNAAEEAVGDEEFGGLFEQVGQVADPEALPSDQNIFVEVLDARTLEPVAGALIVSDGYEPGAPGNPGVVAGVRAETVTDADGRAVVPIQQGTGPLGDPLETVFTIDAATYDLFTFHGATTRFVSVLLESTTASTGTIDGTITAVDDDPEEELLDEGSNVLVADTRRPEGAAPTFESGPCVPTLIATNCIFGPEVVRADQLGAQALLVGEFDGPPPISDLSSFLVGFEALVPVRPVASGEAGSSILAYDGVLDSDLSATTDVVAFDGQPGQLFDQGMLLNDLVDNSDDVSFGPLEVYVEARVPGLDRPLPIGLGVSNQTFGATIGVTADPVTFDPPIVDVQAAYPRRPFNFLPDPDLIDCSTTALGAAGKCLEDIVHFVFAFEDTEGNRAVSRPRLSQQSTFLVDTSDLYPMSLVPSPNLVGIVANELDASGDELFVRFNDVLIRTYKLALPVDGVYSVTITNTDTGRRHTAVRYDDADDDDPPVSEDFFNLDVAFLNTANTVTEPAGEGLGFGPAELQARYYAWHEVSPLDQIASNPDFLPTPPDAFDRQRFLWSELPLQANLFAESGARTFDLIDGTL